MSDAEFDEIKQWVHRWSLGVEGRTAAREAFDSALSAAREEGRREGFEKAREMAEGRADDVFRSYPANDPERGGADAVRLAIRAMRDGAVDVSEVVGRGEG